jgi:hypothetical protein
MPKFSAYANLVRMTTASAAVGVIAVPLCGGVIECREHIEVGIGQRLQWDLL